MEEVEATIGNVGNMDTGIEEEFGMDRVPENGTDVFLFRLVGIFGDDGFAILRDGGGTKIRISSEKAHEVEKVRPEHEKILAAGAVIHHAVDLHLDEITDEFGALGLEADDVGIETHRMENGELQPLLLGEGDQLIRLAQGAGDGTLDTDVGAGLESGLHHFIAFARLPGTDRDEIERLFFEHLAIVAVGGLGTGADLGGVEPRGIGVGDGDEAHSIEALEKEIEPMAEVSGSGVSDRGGAEILRDDRFGCGFLGQVRDGFRGMDRLGAEFDEGSILRDRLLDGSLGRLGRGAFIGAHGFFRGLFLPGTWLAGLALADHPGRRHSGTPKDRVLLLLIVLSHRARGYTGRGPPAMPKFHPFQTFGFSVILTNGRISASLEDCMVRQNVHDSRMSRGFSVLGGIALISGLLLGVPAMWGDESVYSSKEPSRDGTGKVYMGREISQTVSSHAISWLERRDREGEEKPSLVIENLELKPDDVVADIGAGSGYFSFLLAPLVPQGKVLAVDIQQEMLDFVEGRKKLKQVANVETLLGTVEDTRLPEGQVDVVIMVDAYHEFSHPREMMQSIVKGLAPGGRVVFLEYRGEDPKVPIKPLHKMTVKQITREMEAVGLRFVEVRDFLPIQHFLVFQKPAP